MLTVLQPVAAIGAQVIDQLEELGRYTRFAGSTLRWLLLHPGQWAKRRLLLPPFYAVGAASIPVVAITGAFIGMILALEMYAQFAALGQEARLGGVINLSVTKQIGPVLAAVMLAGRVGSALAAELGTMRVTEQLDALRAMACDPIPYLVVPRVVACTLMTPILTMYSDILGVWGGWLVTVKFYGVPSFDFWMYTASFLTWWEPTSGIIKSVLFGASIGLISCYKGFNCDAGASGVGRAATQAFVTSFIAIIMINLVMAKLLNTIGDLYIYTPAVDALG